jgi:hypothetical protein
MDREKPGLFLESLPEAHIESLSKVFGSRFPALQFNRSVVNNEYKSNPNIR